ncbi:MAG TPA: glycosyltransferase [Anaerolineaceae bacterium]|nr:glycosyltransferase [Anaerolineaceae bacterium]HPN52531.1 glycosyltransferase [Anaerolineaceae bacterium]
MQDNILISVIVLTYNQEGTIRQTLESILTQDHTFPYEIVIGDDGSSDHTIEILQTYQEKFPNIIKLYVNEKNLGVVKNYYSILDRCSGKYIMLCAGDDYWLPGKISIQMNFMETNPKVGVLYGVCHIYDTDKKMLIENRNPPVIPKSSYFDALLEGNFIPTLTVCYRRELYTKYINKEIFLGFLMEDYPMWLEFSQHTDFAALPQAVAVYRMSPLSLSGSADEEKYIQFNKAVISIQQYFLSSAKVINPEYKRAKLLMHICINSLLNEKYIIAQYFWQQISLVTLIKSFNLNQILNYLQIKLSIFFRKRLILMRLTG